MATATIPAGLSMCYVPVGGSAPTMIASASIDNATATAFLTWAKKYYAATAGANTNQGAFNTWFNELIATTIQRMTQDSQTTASAAAVAAVVPPVITPAQ